MPLAGKPPGLGCLKGVTLPAPAAGINPVSGFQSNPDEYWEEPAAALLVGSRLNEPSEDEALSLGEECELAASAAPADREPAKCG